MIVNTLVLCILLITYFLTIHHVLSVLCVFFLICLHNIFQVAGEEIVSSHHYFIFSTIYHDKTIVNNTLISLLVEYTLSVL